MEAQAKTRTLTLSPPALRGKQIDLSDETAVYEGIGLRFVEPELREGRGEVESARSGTLPRLITQQDLRGDLHMHSIASDGAHTIEEMAEAAKARGYSYIAITDHSQSLKIARGVSERNLRQQLRDIDRLNAKLRGIVVLKSAEVDILEDGSLDYDDSLLKELDLTICSIHSIFRLDKAKQTNRILRAMDNAYFNILGHPTGRLLLRREGYGLDFDRIIRHARERGCIFEINSNPNRLDLSDEQARIVKDDGVMIAINTDAHSIAELDFISGGINQARRGWLEPHNVLNTLSLTELRQYLQR
jgi:DNA polymerase (family 10)